MVCTIDSVLQRLVTLSLTFELTVSILTHTLIDIPEVKNKDVLVFLEVFVTSTSVNGLQINNTATTMIVNVPRPCLIN